MKKKTLFILAVMMLVCCAAGALADGFDLTGFSLQEYTFEERDNDKGFFIYPNFYFRGGKKIRKITEADFYCDGYYSSIEPYISYVKNEDGNDKMIFFIKMVLCQDDAKMLSKKIVFDVSSKTYTFTLKQDDDDVEHEDEAWLEWVHLPIAKDSVSFMYDWIAENGQITATVYGTKGEKLHFTVPDAMKTMIEDMFIAFRKGGGADMLYGTGYGVNVR